MGIYLCGKPIEVEVDTTYDIYPDVEDVEIIRTRGHEYTIGLLPNGRRCIKSITYKAGHGLSVVSMGNSVHAIKENEKLLDGLFGD